MVIIRKMDMRKIISVKQWNGWILSLLLVWLVGGSVCQAGSVDEVLAYFSANASEIGRAHV